MKQLPINNCDDCKHFCEYDSDDFCEHDNIHKKIETCFLGFPDWCPLSDYKEDDK